MYLIHFSQGERNYIMQVVCEATQSASVIVQVGAFECLVRIMSLYYDKMAFYMERALFGVSIFFMTNYGNPLPTTIRPVDCSWYETY